MRLPSGLQWLRNPDVRLRELERRWKESGTPGAYADYLRAGLRAGALDPEKLWLLARTNAPERPVIEEAVFGEPIPVAQGWGWWGFPNPFALDDPLDLFRDLLARDVHAAAQRGEGFPEPRLRTRFLALAELLGAAERIRAAERITLPERWFQQGWESLPALASNMASASSSPSDLNSMSFIHSMRMVDRALEDFLDIAYNDGAFPARLEVPDRWVDEAINEAGAAGDGGRGYLEELVIERWNREASPFFSEEVEADMEKGWDADWNMHVLVIPNRHGTEQILARLLADALLAWLRDEPSIQFPPRATFPNARPA